MVVGLGYLLPRVLRYISCPIQVLFSALLLVSRFQGLEMTTAAFKGQSSPSSPTYYWDISISSEY